MILLSNFKLVEQWTLNTNKNAKSRTNLWICTLPYRVQATFLDWESIPLGEYMPLTNFTSNIMKSSLTIIPLRVRIQYQPSSKELPLFFSGPGLTQNRRRILVHGNSLHRNYTWKSGQLSIEMVDQRRNPKEWGDSKYLFSAIPKLLLSPYAAHTICEWPDLIRLSFDSKSTSRFLLDKQ